MTTLAFPRYGQSVTADLASEALHGRHGDLAESVYAMAVLRARPRRRRRADRRADLRARRRHPDRYVASNAAYSAARLHQDADGEMVSWVGEFEYDRLGLPVPDRQILLDVSVELAAQRARSRAEQESDRARDAYERDDALQQRTGAVYAQLAARHWRGPWSVVGADVDAWRPTFRPERNSPACGSGVYPESVTPWSP